jgi:tetratricopeptide (TPR) repeat protein
MNGASHSDIGEVNMTKISLRAYNQEIGKLIDHGQTEEASAHCKYILKIFPKHLDTYRLLGKTYLESQRYSEAADILQRVLAVVPDDFVSQIGLSIIREDEGNLDAAIWNMERAFEVQPSNAAVQEELRRLYGNRDGVQPPRVRLTRGALVRMYTKGALYQQAIAEARAAIAESPKRTDLEILLARNYYLSNNFVEATDICSRLVKKMPYCYEANLILAEILPKANKTEEAKIFAKRVQELDPYAAFIDRSAVKVSQVPDEAVTLEKLEWQPSMEDSEQPRWAKSIGVDIGSQSDQESAADWLSDMPTDSPESSSPMPFIIPEINAAKSDESLPGWMKEDEWSTGKHTKIPDESQQTSAFIMDNAEELQEAEIPEWLQSIAPDEIDKGQPPASPAPFEIPESKASDAPDGINGLDADTSATNDSESVSESPFLAGEPSGIDDIPEWMQNMGADDEKKETPVEELSSKQPEFSAIEPDETPFAAETPPEDTPDWLKDLEATTEQPVEQSTATEADEDTTSQESEVPDWLSEIGQDEMPQPEKPETTDAEAPAEDLPDWLQDLDGAKNEPIEQSDTPVDMPGVTDMPAETLQEPDAPDWLSEIGQDETPQPKEPDTTTTTPPTEDLPNWLQDLDGEKSEPIEQSETPVDMPGVTDMLVKPTQEPEVPDWLSEIGQDETPQTVESETTVAAAPAEDLPDWLQDSDGAKSEPIEQSETPLDMPGVTDMLVKPTQETEVPDWLNELAPESETAPATADELPTDTFESQPAADIPQTTDDASDWLQEIDSSESIPQPEVELPAAEEESPLTSDELPDWLQSEEETPAEVQPDTPGLEAALPSAILGAAAMLDGDTDQQTEQTPTPAQDIPDWMSDLAPEPGEPDAPPVSSDDETLTLSHLTEDKASPQVSEGMPEDPDEAFAWLESLAAQHGADEEALSTPVEERDTSIPEWLQETEEETPEVQPEPEIPEEITSDSEAVLAEAVANDSLPDWLQDLDKDTTEAQSVEESPSVAEEIPSDSQSIPRKAATGEIFTDWLKELGDEPPKDKKPIAEEVEPESPPISEDAPAQPAASDALPDWLEDLGGATPLETAPADAETETPPAPIVEESTVSDTQAEKQPTDNDSVPDWLNDLAEADTVQPETTEPQGPQDEAGIALPDWMDSEAKPAEDLAPAAKSSSIPDWLEDLKPADTEPVPSMEETKADETPEVIAEPVPSKPTEDTSLVAPDGETLVTAQNAAEVSSKKEVSHKDGEMPSDPDEAFAWLESLAAKHGADEEALVTAADERQETPPDWVQDLHSEKETQQDDAPSQPDTLSINELDTGVDLLNSSEEAPSEPNLEQEEAEAEALAQQWLQSLASGKPVEEVAADVEDKTSPETTEQPVAAETEEPAPVVQSKLEPAAPADPSLTEEMPSDPDEAFAWLESLAAKQGADEEALSTPAEERDSTTPDWLQGLEETAPEAQPEQEIEPVAEDTSAPVQAEAEPAQEPAAPADPSLTEEMPSDPDEAFAWLESLAAQQGADEEALSTPAEERDSTTPDWLQGLEETTPEAQPEQEIEPVAEDISAPVQTEAEPAQEPAAPAVPSSSEEMPSDPDEAFAWLESLAAKQGADEEALSTPAEERDSTTPDWLQGLEETTPEAQPEQEIEPVAEDATSSVDESDFLTEELPEAMDLPEMESQPAAEETAEAEPPHKATLPEWLKEFEEPVTEETSVTAESEIQGSQDETVIRWLNKMDEEDKVSPLTPISSADEIAEEQPLQSSAAKDVITEPVKAAEEPAAEEILDKPQADSEQSLVEEPEKGASPVIEPIAETITQPEPAPEDEAATEHVVVPTILSEAQKLMGKGQIEESVAIYKAMIEEDTELDDVIKDLNDALLHHPIDTILWLTLGDAYMQKKEMQSALSAYAKAEEILR